MSYNHLSLEKRHYINTSLKKGMSLSQIARDLDKFRNQHITIKGRIRTRQTDIDLLPMVLDSISIFKNEAVIKK